MRRIQNSKKLNAVAFLLDVKHGDFNGGKGYRTYIIKIYLIYKSKEEKPYKTKCFLVVAVLSLILHKMIKFNGKTRYRTKF